MEDIRMGKAMKAEDHVSAAAFVEGGIQDACDDACSICLEAFSENDPSTVTNCKHEFHLQCILEWCQRSSQCPMCWQPISLKDPTSQDLFDGVEQERNIQLTPPRDTTIFHHPTLGDFELRQLPVGASDHELEEHIIQHLAAAAAMGRTRHNARREGHRSRPPAHGRPHFVVFSTHPNAPRSGPHTASISQVEEESEHAVFTVASPSSPMYATGVRQFSPVDSTQISRTTSGSSVDPTDQQLFVNSRPYSLPNPDRAGPSDFQSFSESLKSKFNALSRSQSSLSNPDSAGPSDLQSITESIKTRFNVMSMRYKDSFAKSTKELKEKLFPRITAANDIGSVDKGEVNVGIASVSRVTEGRETKKNGKGSHASASDCPAN